MSEPERSSGDQETGSGLKEPHSQGSFPWVKWRPTACYSGVSAKLIIIVLDAWELCRHLRRDPTLFQDESRPLAQANALACHELAAHYAGSVESKLNPDGRRFDDPVRRARKLFGCDQRTSKALDRVRDCFDVVLVALGWQCVCEGKRPSMAAAQEGLIPEADEGTVQAFEAAVFGLRDALEANPPERGTMPEGEWTIDPHEFWSKPYLLDEVLLGGGKRLPIRTTDIRIIQGQKSFCCPRARFAVGPNLIADLDRSLRERRFLKPGQILVYVGPQDVVASLCDCLAGGHTDHLDRCNLTASADWSDWANRYASLVLHLGITKTNGDLGSGTAFLCKTGRFATCAHNVVGHVRVHAYVDNREAEIERMLPHPTADVATFSLPGDIDVPKESMPLRDELPSPGEEVAALGFPAIPQRQPTLGIYPGHVESCSPDYSGSSRFIQVSIQTAGGLSGGPVIDRRGRVLGIVSERTFEDVADERIPARSFRQVVPISYLLELADSDQQ